MATVECDGPQLSAGCGETLEQWIKPLQLRLTGAPYPLIKAELQATVADFYQRTLAWRDTVGPFTVNADDEFVYLNPIDNYANVIHTIEAYIQKSDNDKRGLGVLTRPPYLRTPAEPDSFFCAEPYTLQLSPRPLSSLGAVLYVYAALTPIKNADRLPQIAVSHHFEAILAGAISRLASIPNKPWTDGQLAEMKRREYRRGIVEARDAANRGYSASADTPFRFPRFT